MPEMNESETEKRIGDYLASIEQQLTQILSKGFSTSSLISGAHYAVFPGGKRIRPLLLMLLCEDCDSLDLKTASRVGAALELLHCASLVHDDLPALDNDDERRGRPSLHRAFDEGTALLVGDALVPLVIEVITKLDLPASIKLALCQCLSEAYRALCEGQQLERDSDASSSETAKVHALKTGALFGATCAAAALLSHQEKIAHEFYDFGLAVGLLFQAADDVIDIGHTPETFERFLNAKNHCEHVLEKLEQHQNGKVFSGTRYILGQIAAQIKTN